MQIWEQLLALEVLVLFLARQALQTFFPELLQLRNYFFLTTLALAYTNKGPNIESSAPVGIMEAIPEGTQLDDSLVIPDDKVERDR